MEDPVGDGEGDGVRVDDGVNEGACVNLKPVEPNVYWLLDKVVPID